MNWVTPGRIARTAAAAAANRTATLQPYTGDDAADIRWFYILPTEQDCWHRSCGSRSISVTEKNPSPG